MSLKVYINGRLVDREDAKVSVFDHGFLFGDGIFEGLRCYNGKIFRLKQHIDRLWDSAKTLDIQIPVTKEEMSAAMYQTLEANGFTGAEPIPAEEYSLDWRPEAVNKRIFGGDNPNEVLFDKEP